MSDPPLENLDLDAKSDVLRAVTDLMDAAQHMQHDPRSVEGVESLIGRLKELLHEERNTYSLTHQNSESRKKIESLHYLIQFLESEVQKTRKAEHRSGLRYYLARVSNTVWGHEVGRIGQNMESKLQSWLDQQGIREVADVVSSGSEDARLKAISSLENVVQKGFDALLQDTILSSGLVEKLAALLEPGAASWDVQKEAAFALAALLNFNKDIFVSLVLMAKVVGNLLKLMDAQPEQHVLVLVCVLKSLLSAGQTLIADEIFAQDGVAKLVNLLDHKSQAVKLAGLDCVFELAYHGRMEVVQKMFELEVIQKLGSLHQSSMSACENGNGELLTNSKQERSIDLLRPNGGMVPESNKQMQVNKVGKTLHPFSNAITRFALHFAVGTGLRKRERRALKQQFLKQIKEIVHDDAELANITAEILWAP